MSKNSPKSHTSGVCKSILRLCIFSALILFLNQSVFADRMGSSNYELLFTNINSGGTTTSSSNYTLDMSLGQNAAMLWDENGYIVKAGFQYIHTLYPFTFELSDTTLDFGTLVAGTPSSEQLSVTVSHRGQGYQVMVYQDHKLRNFDNSAWIEDTACDDPFCDEDTAEEWVLNSVYGFGYNVTGHDVSSDFNASADYFRPFSTDPITFMESTEIAKDRQSLLTAKVNINGAQAAGTYQTVLRFIAIPKF